MNNEQGVMSNVRCTQNYIKSEPFDSLLILKFDNFIYEILPPGYSRSG